MKEELVEHLEAFESGHTGRDRNPEGFAATQDVVMALSQERLARAVERLGLRDPRIASAFRTVDRADFVPHDLRAVAYADRPLGIPHEQTTSQPTLIAMMIDAAEVGPGDHVLEVGTGYGFQTALLARLAARVVSVERWSKLAAEARDNLRRAGIVGVDVHAGDGFEGWPEGAPYDAVIVSAAAARLPDALVRQLAEGGRLVVPLVEAAGDIVTLFRKRNGALVRERVVTPARFVPLIQGIPPHEAEA
ncbi:MAG TPA: protein-L-isoaspartate(D-aspartate) O-methyltransferase [Actinomycetota bacterium]|nr:protein-L-isoaspartate(D-aspartate) O-methyltransferase [Actinomycetota bacterium]